MKICRNKDCTNIKPQPFTNFVKDERYKDGYQNRCKSCQKKYDALRFKNNQQVILAKSAIYYRNNLESARKRRAEYRKSHKELQKALEANWRKNNPGKAREKCRRYQAKKLNATPKWLTDEHVKELQRIYSNCPKDYEVDHVIPIQGKNVSGLHVPWNLQYMLKSVNRSKSNKY